MHAKIGAWLHRNEKIVCGFGLLQRADDCRDTGNSAQSHKRDHQNDCEKNGNAKERTRKTSAADIAWIARKNYHTNKADERNAEKNVIFEIRPRGERSVLLRQWHNFLIFNVCHKKLPVKCVKYRKTHPIDSIITHTLRMSIPIFYFCLSSTFHF